MLNANFINVPSWLIAENGGATFWEEASSQKLACKKSVGVPPTAHEGQGALGNLNATFSPIFQDSCTNYQGISSTSLSMSEYCSTLVL